MKFIRYFLVLISVFGGGSLWSGAFSSARLPGLPDVESSGEVIKDTVFMTMETMAPICIDEKVLLRCDNNIVDRDVLKYTWTDKATGQQWHQRDVWVSPKTTTTYSLNVEYIKRSQEKIVQGDFGTVEKQLSSFQTSYRYVGQYWNSLYPEGVYTIAKSTGSYHQGFWKTPDHTGDGGCMMVVNGSTGKNVNVWRQTISGLTPGQQYAFSTWGLSVTDGHHRVNGLIITPGKNLPVWQFSINGVPFGKTFKLTYKAWNQFYEVWTATSSTAVISLVDHMDAQDGNDFAMDDISFAPIVLGYGEVQVKVLPAMDMSALADLEVCEGGSLEVDANATGSTITGYKWVRGNDGVVVSTQPQMSVTNADPVRDDGSYTCTVTGVCGDRTEEFDIRVREKIRTTDKVLTAPAACIGSRVELNASRVTGYGLKYKWTPPAGARSWQPVLGNENRYYKASVDRADNGMFTCVVTGQCGKDTIFTVLPIKEQLTSVEKPRDTIVCKGQLVRFRVHSATPDVRVTWTLPNGVMVPGEEILVQVDRPSVYKWKADNGCGTPLTGSVFADVYDRLELLSVSPADTSVCPGSRVEVKSRVKGPVQYYSWRGPGGFTADTKDIVLEGMNEAKSGVYNLTVTGVCEGERVFASTKVSVLKEYEGVKITKDTVVCKGAENVVLEVTGGDVRQKCTWTNPAGRKFYGPRLVLPTVGLAEAGDYVCRIEGVCRDSVQVVSLDVYGSLTASGNTGVHRVCPGSNYTLRVDPQDGIVSYTWKKNGTETGDGTNTLVLNNIQAADAAIYTCEVVGHCESKVLQYEIQLKPGTAITSFTPDQYISVNEGVRLFVSAVGENCHYEWKKDGMQIGADENKLFIEKMDRAGTYTFTCTVRGDCGEITQRIVVYVGDYNTITEDKAVELCEKMDYSYNAKIRPQGCPENVPLTYRWEFKGTVVSGTSVLQLANLSAAKEGRYTCYVTGSCGQAEVNLDVKVILIPVIGGMPNTVEVCEGGRFHIRATVEANDMVSYRWEFNGRQLDGNTEMLSFESASLEDRGVYTCNVIGRCGDAAKHVTVKVIKALKVLDYTDTLKVCEGDPATLEVVATGDGISYQWTGPNRANWTGADKALYRNLSVSGEKDAGEFRCVVTGECGRDTVFPVVDIEPELTLLAVSQSDTVCPGSEVTLYARVNIPGVRYTWTSPDGTVSHAEKLVLRIAGQQQAGVYSYRVESRCSEVTGQIRLGVYREPGELKISRDTAVCRGAEVHFLGYMNGEKVKYAWKGPKRFTSSNAEIVITDVDSLKAGTYDLTATDVCNQVKTGQVKLSLLQEFKDLKISRDTTVCEGENVAFGVTGGVAGLTYEWSLDGVVLGNGTRLQLAAVSQGSAGTYVCRVTGTCGSVELRVRLSVYKPLTVADHIGLIRECKGSTVDLVATAEGERVRYRWFDKNGVSRGTDSILRIEDIIPSDAGQYVCRISSMCGSTDLNYELQIKEDTRIVQKTPDKFVTENDPTKLQVFTKGENNHYTWSLDGNVLGNDAELLVVPDVGLADTLKYVCVVTGDCGTDTAMIEIRVGVFRSLKETTSPDTLCEKSTYTYVADMLPPDCYGFETFEYEWKHNGTPIGDGALLRLEDINDTHAGEYSCRMTNDCGEIIRTWKVTVIKVPELVSLTPDAFITEGADHRIEAVAAGDELRYEWEKDGISYEKGRKELIFEPVSYEDRGVYKVTVKNRCSAVSGISELKVWQKTTIISPLDQEAEVCPGDDTVFVVEALGSTGLVYNWYHDGVRMDVASVRRLTLKDIQPEDGGEYKCIVSGRGGDDSCFIRLTVKALPKVKIEGEFSVCLNAAGLLQGYEAVSDELRLRYSWSVSGGVLNRNDRKNTEVSWDGSVPGKLELEVVSEVTGCRNRDADSMVFKALPELWLDMPDSVGYCIDSMKLNQAYPSGGYYLVNGVEDDFVYFYYKDEEYRIEYRYTDLETGCPNSVAEDIGIGPEPFIVLRNEQLETGLCLPVTLSVARASRGEIKWEGRGDLETGDVMNAVYIPKEEDGKSVYFTAELTDQYNCRASDFVTVSVVPLPRAEALADNRIGACTEDTLAGVYYTPRLRDMVWHPTGDVRMIGDGKAVITHKTPGDNIYWVVATDIYGCEGRDSVTVYMLPSPPVEDSEFCADRPLTVECGSYNGYSWSDGYTGPVRVLDEKGDYALEIRDEFDCVGTVHYSVHPLPPVNLRDTMLFEGQSSEFRLQLEDRYGPYDVVWQDGSSTFVYRFEKEGDYWVEVKDNLGCTGRDSAYVEVQERHIAAPDAFLPGSGGENSKFYLKEVNFVETFEMFIYDRWGELVHRTGEIGFNGGWDGTFKGADCQPGAYLWVAYANGKMIGRGTLMLVR